VEISEKMIYLFRNSNVTRSLGINGEKNVADKFSVNNYVHSIEKVLKDIVHIQRS
jgi:hypothetical protein